MTSILPTHKFFYQLYIELLEDGSVPQEQGLKHWAKLYEVFCHPRCANCHVDEAGVPMWSGPSYGKARPDGMNIKAGESRIGAETLLCTTCHQQQNGALPHSPPGAELWLLPAPEMVWYEKTSAEICAHIQDSTRNGDRTMAEVIEHIANDERVHWGGRPEFPDWAWLGIIATNAVCALILFVIIWRNKQMVATQRKFFGE